MVSDSIMVASYGRNTLNPKGCVWYAFSPSKGKAEHSVAFVEILGKATFQGKAGSLCYPARIEKKD